MANGWDQKDLDALKKRRQPAQAAPQTTNAAKVGKELPKRPQGGFDAFVALLGANGLPLPVTEYVFLETRRFKADYAWPAQKVIVERQGGLWAKDKEGENNRAKRAHTLPLAILRDYEKANLAQLAGWTYLQFTPTQLDSGEIIELLRARLCS